MWVDGDPEALTPGFTMGFPFDLGDSDAQFGVGVRVDADGQSCAAGGSQPFTGDIDEVAVFDLALNADEVRGLFEAGAGGVGLD